MSAQNTDQELPWNSIVIPNGSGGTMELAFKGTLKQAATKFFNDLIKFQEQNSNFSNKPAQKDTPTTDNKPVDS